MAAYLRFSLNGARYAVDARNVLEIVRLAELTLADEAPPHIAGLINLRGRIAPVMSLDLRLGHALRRYQLSDSIVMLQSKETVIGAIVNDVSEVIEIADAAVESLPHYDGELSGHVNLLSGNAKVGDEIVMLLDVPRLIHARALAAGAVPRPADQAYFCPEATAQEREVFHQRAQSLMQAVERQEMAELIPLSLVRLGEECFGIELDVVREFSSLHHVTPIPCCPPHIAGNTNLRGDILTLVDIRGLLNIAANGAATNVMVIESNDLYIGVPVEQVLEVVYADPSDIIPLPAAVHEEKSEYCKGAVRYGQELVSILDMMKILSKGKLEVEEEV
ncbi:MAG TPA: chemotaxis protein CheW [Gallionella sp.]|nr:chemotaxis protein CheW [Gallionella sp.]